MARILLQRRYWQRLEERRRALAPGVVSRWRLPMNAPPFVDYWPEVPATVPEKMVFADLVRRQINFYFSWYFGDLRITPDVYERYRPDFYLPDYRIIIEVAGVYWHTRPGSYERDLTRAFLLTATGYKVYVVTDAEVLLNVREALNRIPEVAAANIKGNNHFVGDRPLHPTAALRARLRKWPKVRPVKWARARGAIKPAASWVVSGRKPMRPEPEHDPIFLGLSEELIREAQELHENWRKLRW